MSGGQAVTKDERPADRRQHRQAAGGAVEVARSYFQALTTILPDHPILICGLAGCSSYQTEMTMPTPWRAIVRPVMASLPLSRKRWNAVLVRRTCTFGFGQPVVDLLIYLWRVGSDDAVIEKKAPASTPGPKGLCR